MAEYIAKYVGNKVFKETAKNKFGAEDPYFEKVPATRLGVIKTTRKKRKAPKEPNPKSLMKKKKKANPMERKKEERREDGEAVASDNIIGEISDSVRRSKFVRRRKSHKKASKGMEDSIPALPNMEGQQS